MINGLSDDVRFIRNLVIIFFVFFLCFFVSFFFLPYVLRIHENIETRKRNLFWDCYSFDNRVTEIFFFLLKLCKIFVVAFFSIFHLLNLFIFRIECIFSSKCEFKNSLLYDSYEFIRF